jgi:branched-chain amino acid transport system permease protein
MSLETLVNLSVSGVTLGAIYLLMAIGLTLVFGITRVLNYAQGSLFTWGGYAAWCLTTKYLHWDYWAVIPVVTALFFCVGVLFEKAVVSPLRRFQGWETTAIIVTLGCALLLDNLALVVFNPLSKTIPHLLEGPLRLGFFSIAKHNAAMMLVTVGVLIALWFFLERTRVGMAMRAVAQDTMGAKIVGLPVDRLYAYSFGISTALAAVAAILLVPRTLLYPLVGWSTVLKAFVVIVLGGLGNIKGTVVAALVLGIAEIFISYFVGGMWALPIFLVFLVATLVVSPKGLFGRW